MGYVWLTLRLHCIVVQGDVREGGSSLVVAIERILGHKPLGGCLEAVLFCWRGASMVGEADRMNSAIGIVA